MHADASFWHMFWVRLGTNLRDGLLFIVSLLIVSMALAGLFITAWLIALAPLGFGTFLDIYFG